MRAQRHQKAATDAFLAQYDAIEDNEASIHPMETQSLRFHHDTNSNRSRKVLREIYGNDSVQGDELLEPGLPSHAGFGFSNTSSNPTIVGHDVDSNATVARVTQSSSDINTKGYSSVSVQNVHALGRLPQNLDGSNEAHRIAKYNMAQVNKAKSPRLVHRNTAGGDYWYGPFCRQAIERALAEDDSVARAKQVFK